jgi:hypothetical protein
VAGVSSVHGSTEEIRETHIVLDTVASLAEDVVLQIQQLESRVDVRNELADLQRPGIVAEGDRVHRQTRL